MKADRMGTHTEQVRARMCWVSPTELKAALKAAGHETYRTCSTCKYKYLKETPNREGGASGNYSPYCGHPQAAGDAGHATREGATCNHWEAK